MLKAIFLQFKFIRISTVSDANFASRKVGLPGLCLMMLNDFI